MNNKGNVTQEEMNKLLKFGKLNVVRSIKDFKLTDESYDELIKEIEDGICQEISRYTSVPSVNKKAHGRSKYYIQDEEHALIVNKSKDYLKDLLYIVKLEDLEKLILEKQRLKEKEKQEKENKINERMEDLNRIAKNNFLEKEYYRECYENGKVVKEEAFYYPTLLGLMDMYYDEEIKKIKEVKTIEEIEERIKEVTGYIKECDGKDDWRSIIDLRTYKGKLALLNEVLALLVLDNSHGDEFSEEQYTSEVDKLIKLNSDILVKRIIAIDDYIENKKIGEDEEIRKIRNQQKQLLAHALEIVQLQEVVENINIADDETVVDENEDDDFFDNLYTTDKLIGKSDVDILTSFEKEEILKSINSELEHFMISYEFVRSLNPHDKKLFVFDTRKNEILIEEDDCKQMSLRKFKDMVKSCIKIIINNDRAGEDNGKN